MRRFTESAAEVMGQIDKLIPDGANVFFAHTMAGGIPKIKAFLAIANRIYKGRGERFMSSRALLDSDLGKLILMNFDEVTANTLGYLITASTAIRERVQATGGSALHGLRLPRHRDPDRRQVPVANLHQLHPGLRQEASGKRGRGRVGQGYLRDRVQLPGNPHQFLRHLRRRRIAAVPPAERAQARKRRQVGPAAMGCVPGPARRRRPAANPARHDRRLQR
ncbi:hypothetical protein LP419_33935 [Massilia sp. H-1]|nr:hypothetical protein LP419_33935 [Massilia sp. H-1]